MKRQKLAKKFGNKFAIAEAFKLKAERWPDVKPIDSKQWMSFSVFMHEYWNTLCDLNFNHDFDQSNTVKFLLDKLPYGVRNQWRVLADDLFQKEERVPGFDEFVKFVDRQARLVNHPVYGNIHVDTPKQQTKQQTKPDDSRQKKRRSFATTATTKSEDKAISKKCDYCHSDTHNMAVCRNLLKRPHSERIDYMYEEKWYLLWMLEESQSLIQTVHKQTEV